MKQDRFLKSEIHNLSALVWDMKHLLFILEEITVNGNGNLSQTDIFTLQNIIITLSKKASKKASIINNYLGV